LAEETGLIVPIGEWVLRTACVQNKAWQDAGLPKLRISVNLSSRQFQEKNLVETVRKVLVETGLEPKYLELELTESMLQNTDSTAAVLRELHALGVYLSVDDFGTGYSSLNYLKRFPIDNLKIDRSFVRDVTTDPDDAAITDAIISMAHTLGIRVVAEGVETREQLVFLHQHKCDFIQGYYFSKPLPAETFVELLRTGRRLTPRERLVAPEIKIASG
jgi:EAL domain-containing protein (putative c-di-GMP-specific phosphodiesterase class I)